MNFETRNPSDGYSGNIEDYYMIDYQVVDHPQWVRKPFVHKEDLARVMVYEVGRHASNTKDIRVLPEKWLSELRDTAWNDETRSYEKDVITNRTNIFGVRYEEIAEGITGVKSLNQI